MPPTDVAPVPVEEPVKPSPTVQVSGTPEQRARNQSALDHLAQRLAAAETLGPTEAAEADREWREFARSVNENRMSNRLRYVE